MATRKYKLPGSRSDFSGFLKGLKNFEVKNGVVEVPTDAVNAMKVLETYYEAEEVTDKVATKAPKIPVNKASE